MGFAHAYLAKPVLPFCPSQPLPQPQTPTEEFSDGRLHMGVPRMTFSAPLALMTSW